MIVKAYPATIHCESVYAERKHIVLGISPFNSYFSVERITALSGWAAHNFESFSLFIPDEPSVYTLMALGYDKPKATKKAERQADYLKNKCLRSLAELSISEKEAEHIILNFDYLNTSEAYHQALKFYKEKYADDISFREKCLETSEQVVKDKVDTINKDMLEIAVKYLLAEMPLFFNSADILNKKSAMFCYKDCAPFIKTCFEQNRRFVPDHQGYLVVDTEYCSEVPCKPNH